MKIKELQAEADLWEGDRVEGAIRSLSLDARFPAVLALLSDVRFGRLAHGSSVSVASDHGALAHCMGAIDAIDELRQRVQVIVEGPEHGA